MLPTLPQRLRNRTRQWHRRIGGRHWFSQAPLAVVLAQPDVVIAPQILGGELAAVWPTGEPITADYVLKRVFPQRGGDAQQLPLDGEPA